VDRRPAAAELDRLARARWWEGDVPGAIQMAEQAHEVLVRDGEPVEVAERAFRICLAWAVRGDVALATAWLTRGRRLLDGQPTGRVHGIGTYLAAAIDLDLDGDPEPAASAGRELAALSQDLDDRTLECFSLTLTGMAAVRSGDLDGFAGLDEAMIPIVGGQVDPVWAGDIYCSVIHLCEALGDLARMRAWTDALGAWAAPLSDTFMYAAVTRVHQLQLLRAEGAWDEVERELGAQSAVLANAHGWLAGTGFYELGEVHRLRGRGAAALASYSQARALSVEPQPGEALLLHAAGRSADALAGLRVALADAGRLGRARLLLPAVEIVLALDQPDAAADLAAELDDTARHFAAPGPLAAAAQARAARLMHDGDPDGAAAALEEAARIHRRQRHRYASAQVHERLAEAHRARGDAAAAAAEHATALAIYTRLGAAPDVARLSPGRPGGLTGREWEVLRHVASGATNREVADALVISTKTVSRHLVNIFTKIDVTSRTAAAAWAHEHDH
jgi:DNA-binding NarL/FixJ family response regulator